jgi:hypothetical protein
MSWICNYCGGNMKYIQNICLFLGMFATKSYSKKLRHVYMPVIRPFVCQSVRMNQLKNRGTDFHKIWYWRILLQSVGTPALLKSDDSKENFT